MSTTTSAEVTVRARRSPFWGGYFFELISVGGAELVMGWGYGHPDTGAALRTRREAMEAGLARAALMGMQVRA